MEVQTKHLYLSAVVVIFFMLVSLISMPTSIVYSQFADRYVCGQWTLKNDTSRTGGWWFNPYPYDGKEQEWRVLNVLPEWNWSIQDGDYTKVWNSVLEDFPIAPILVHMDRYEIVSDCEPKINFTVSAEPIVAGGCTQLTWKVDVAGLNAVYLDDQSVNLVDSVTECPLSTAIYQLRVSTSYGDYYPEISVNVITPTNTPILTNTITIPTRTRISQMTTDVLPTQSSAPLHNTPPHAEQNSTLLFCTGTISVIVFFVIINRSTNINVKIPPKRKKE
jgi:hypothetical protein